MIAALRPARVWAAYALLALTPGCETIDLSEFTGASPPPPAEEKEKEEGPERIPDTPYLRTGEIFTGKMSWYSVRTNGGTRTASGEALSDHADTAAHPTLPFGTYVEVTNLHNDRRAILRITDRGPYTHGRVLDVSIGAARRLGFEKHGVVSCRVEVLREEEKDEEKVEESPSEPKESEAAVPEKILASEEDSEPEGGEGVRDSTNS